MATNTELQQSVDDARDAYDKAHGMLVASCADIFQEPDVAADSLLAMAEELDAVEAVRILRQDCERIGAVRTDIADTVPRALIDRTESALEGLQDARDQLDLATAKRETAKPSRSADEPQIMNFGGREFAIDLKRGELRSVDNDMERYALPAELLAKRADAASQLSLTEALEKEQPGVPAQPRDVGRGTRGR